MSVRKAVRHIFSSSKVIPISHRNIAARRLPRPLPSTYKPRIESSIREFGFYGPKFMIRVYFTWLLSTICTIKLEPFIIDEVGWVRQGDVIHFRAECATGALCLLCGLQPFWRVLDRQGFTVSFIVHITR